MKPSNTFVDEVRIRVSSGSGGSGSTSFRREKFVPNGGPDGGKGGRGGDVTLLADRNLSTLLELRERREFRAERGRDGSGSRRTGASGRGVEIRVPLGTLVFEDEAGEDAEALVDLARDGQRFVAARGGRGGAGNARFATATRQAPDFAKPGESGQTRCLWLSLKILADVGLIGFPNVGKSTLLRRISAARPRVAAYPFTTLTPSLGVVEVQDSRFVVADIPGLVEGASSGVGLGDRFLRHVERTRVLVHLLDVGGVVLEGRDASAEYQTIRRELGRYRPELLERLEIIALNKIDLIPDPAILDELEAQLRGRGREVVRISAATGEGVEGLQQLTLRALESVRAREGAEADGARRGEAHP